MKTLPLFLLLLSIVSISSKSKEEWLSRSIYQLLTDRFARTSDTGSCILSKYCGGNYKGLIKHLDYIKNMGFDAIWISPIVKNTEGSYHGYHMIDLYSLNEHFGTEQDFIDLVTACHEKDIWVMVDVVANHVGSIEYSKINPFNSSEYYHDECDINDWNNQTQVENCRLSGLPDLKQENDYVTEKLLEWIQQLVSKYNIDGIRVDTVLEVPTWFWDKFNAAAGVFQIGEAFNGNVEYIAPYAKHFDSIFNYPLYYTIFDSFCNSFNNLEYYWFNTRDKWPDPKYPAIFIENHDNQRFLYRCNDRKKFKNAVAFLLLWEGIPVFYYGSEQWFNGGSDPNNREPLWDNYNTDTEIYTMLAI